MKKLLEFVVMVFSLTGATMISFGLFTGFWFFLVANVLGGILFFKTKMWYLFVTQLVFGVTSVNGIYQNL